MPRKSSLESRAGATPRVQRRKAGLHWEPSATLRRAGFSSVPLGPLSVEALNRADELNAAADAHLARGKAQRHEAPRTALVTMQEIFDRYLHSPEYRTRAPKTRRGYADHLKRLGQHFGPEAALAVSPRAVRAWHQKMHAQHPSYAHACWRTLRLVCAWAVNEELLPSNPAAGLRPPTPGRRRRIAPREELAALVATADRMGRPSIGDWCLLAVTSMQRVEDVLRLGSDHLDNGRVYVTQGKTGKEVNFRLHPAVTDRMGDLAARIGPWIVSEETGRAYGYDNFAHWFEAVRAEAAKTCKSLMGEDRRIRDPNLQGRLLARDLRRTGMVWAAQAGAEIPEIVSVSGHDIQHGTQILEVYLPRGAFSFVFNWLLVSGVGIEPTTS